MSTQNGIFVRMTRFHTYSYSFTFLEEEPDGFETGECAADAAVLACRPASLRAGGTATNEISLFKDM